MKKFTKVFLIVCLMFALVLSLVACATGTTGKDEQGRYILAAPEISIENNLITWKKNPKTDKYGVKINDEEEIEINRPSYTLLGDKDATVKVRALGDNVDTVSSEYSNEVSYKAKLQLANPQMPTYEIIGDDIVLRWNAIEGAVSYQIEQTHTLTDNSSVNKVVRYTSETNSYTIAKSTFAAPDIYYFRVMAVGDNDHRNSNYSELLSYAVTQTLDVPAPRLGDSKINWNKVDKATNYVIYLEKVVENGESKRIAVSTVSSGTTSFDEPNFATSIETYKKEMEKQMTGTFDIEGSYKMYVQAVHSSHPEIYLSSAIDEVKKIEGEGESATTKDIVFRKPGNVENIDLRKATIGTGDDIKDVEMLYWNKVEGYDNYRVRFYTNNSSSSLVSETIDITKTSGNSQANVTEIFDRASDHIGKVYNVSISTASKFAEGLLEGEETYWMKDADNKMEYCPKLNELEVEATVTFKDYYRISTIGGLQYMLEHKKAGNDSNNYYLTKDINGGSSTSCNLYFYQDSVLKGIFDGNNKVISNINIIVENDGAVVHLFKTIESGAVIKNVTFNNITIQTLEGKKYTSVSLIAGTNKGTIENVHIINSKLQTTCETAGFVITNDGEINHCSLYDTDIVAKGYTEPKDENANTRADETAGNACNVAGIAITNNNKIFNVSIYEAEITATTKFVDIKAGGVAIANNAQASITNSFVRNSLVKAVTSSGGTQRYSIVGGYVAENAGMIKESYLAHDGSTSRAVEAINVANLQSGSKRLSIAGGLVGRMSGGNISKCYVSYASIIAEYKVSGLIGEITSTFASSEEFVIDNSYVYRITLYDATEKEMVVNDSSSKIVEDKIKNVYCAKIEQNSSARTTHATNVSVSKMIEQKLDGFVVYLSASEQPLLRHMIYADRYKATYSGSAKRDNDVYVIIDANRQDLCPIKYESDLSSYGKKVDVYWRIFTITEGEGEGATTTELTLFFPKYITVN